MTSQHWSSVCTVAAATLAVAGAVYACWVLLPSIWADADRKETVVTFLIVFVVAFAVTALGSRIWRSRHR